MHCDEDPNPNAARHLHQTLELRRTPIAPIQPVNDTTRLVKLRHTLGRFMEKERRSRLGREARLMDGPEKNISININGNRGDNGEEYGKSDLVRVRVMRPRVQLLSETKRSQQAYDFFTVTVDEHINGLELKATIASKQAALGLTVLRDKDARIFVHELAGSRSSPFIGREIHNQRQLVEFGITPESYDATVWQNQKLVAPLAAVSVLLVDARPGVILRQQSDFMNECLEQEVPCYRQLS